jgi:hypothetical protein
MENGAMAIWYIVVIWYIPTYSRFGILQQEKSGNPALDWGKKRKHAKKSITLADHFLTSHICYVV